MADQIIPLFKVHMPPTVSGELDTVLGSGYVAEGPKVKLFEQALAQIVQREVLALNSGTSALTLAYRLAQIGRGDEVVTTPMTCTATNLPILGAGATPVWADVDPNTGLIDPDDVRNKITPSTKAIVCVDWGGMPCDLWRLSQMAAGVGVPLIEDAAHALGAYYRGTPVGAHADLTAFSFQAIKHITTGDGGALATLWHEDYERGRLLRWFGIDRDAPNTGDSRIDVDIAEWGYKFHMNDIAATIGLAQLPFLQFILDAHRANASFYSKHLDRNYFVLPLEGQDERSAWWLYTILLPGQSEREHFKKFMAQRGIQVSQVHRRNDGYTVFRPFERGPLPGLDKFSNRMICIPVHWALTAQERGYIVDSCNDFARVLGGLVGGS